ncbi:MAG: MCE family protein [Betaproteobacteria bacterium]|nr:MCE family protein [Betaproteobacteria bacterium]
MENRAHALVAGVFALALGFATAAAAWWLSGGRDDTRDVVLVTTRSVDGLNVQSQVRFRGLRVGKVRDIRIDPADPRRMLVTARIAATTPISTHTRARLGVQGVTGIAYVTLDDDGTGEPLVATPGDHPPQVALDSSQMEGLTDAAREVAVQVRDLVGRVNRVLDQDNLDRLSRTLSSLEAASAGLESAGRRLPGVIAGVQRVLAPENLRQVQAMLGNLERASADAAPLVADMRSLVQSMQGTAARVGELTTQLGSGVASDAYPRANALLRDLQSNSRRLGRLLEDLERSPQSLVFGRQKPSPGPGESGFAWTGSGAQEEVK